MAGITITFEGEEADLLRSLQALVREQDKVEENYEKIGEKSSRAQREGIKATDELKAALEENNQTLDQYARGLGRVRSLVKRSEDATDRYKRDVQLLNVAKREGRITEEEHSRALRESERQMRRNQEQGEKTHGDSSLMMIKRYAAGVLTIGTAFQTVRSIAQRYQEDRDKALQSEQGLQDSRRQLAQVSKGDLDALEKRADFLAAEYGISRIAARNLVFTARSEGFEGGESKLARLDPVISTEASATVAGQLTNLFQGQLTSSQSINAALAASERSRLNFEQISRALPTVAAAGLPSGFNAQSQLGSLSVLSTDFKSGDVAAARLAALQSRIGLRGKGFGIDTSEGLLSSVRQVAALPEEKRKKFLGESREVNEAFDAFIRNFSTIEKRIQFINQAIKTTGGEQDFAERRVREFLSGTERGQRRAGLIELEKAKIAAEIAREGNLAQKEIQTQIDRETVEKVLQETGVSATGRTVSTKFRQIQDASSAIGLDEPIDPESERIIGKTFHSGGTVAEAFSASFRLLWNDIRGGGQAEEDRIRRESEERMDAIIANTQKDPDVGGKPGEDN